MKKIIKHYPMTDRLIVRRGYILWKKVPIHVECARLACSLVFLPAFSMSSQNVQYGKNVTLFLYHYHLHNVSKLTCYAARRNIERGYLLFNAN
jgi:hypothetical protein